MKWTLVTDQSMVRGFSQWLYCLTAIYRAQRSQHSDWNANSFAANIMPAGDKKKKKLSVQCLLYLEQKLLPKWKADKRIARVKRKITRNEKPRLRSSPLWPSVKLNRTSYVASHSAHSASQGQYVFVASVFEATRQWSSFKKTVKRRICEQWICSGTDLCRRGRLSPRAR